MVRLVLEYVCTVWDPHREGQITKIKNVQWRSARFVLNRYKRTTSVANLLNHLGWTSLQSRWKIARLTMMSKITNNMVQVDFGRLHKTQEQKLRTPTKRDRQAHSKQPAQVQCLRDNRRYTFLPPTILDWNDSLTEAVAGATSPGVFTSGARKLLQYAVFFFVCLFFFGGGGLFFGFCSCSIFVPTPQPPFPLPVTSLRIINPLIEDTLRMKMKTLKEDQGHSTWYQTEQLSIVYNPTKFGRK